MRKLAQIVALCAMPALAGGISDAYESASEKDSAGVDVALQKNFQNYDLYPVGDSLYSYCEDSIFVNRAFRRLGYYILERISAEGRGKYDQKCVDAFKVAKKYKP